MSTPFSRFEIRWCEFFYALLSFFSNEVTHMAMHMCKKMPHSKSHKQSGRWGVCGDGWLLVFHYECAVQGQREEKYIEIQSSLIPHFLCRDTLLSQQATHRLTSLSPTFLTSLKGTTLTIFATPILSIGKKEVKETRFFFHLYREKRRANKQQAMVNSIQKIRMQTVVCFDI